ncbi:trypsin-like peptidase domain-containing protein [Streptomyces actinomycinicus]|uniref:Trypsin-like peptidase domain-containing protein n=1 Tax=Streptomyces actinomycinicus TaxID=1695166 RepID=A0A937JND2_9ACTN|nr:trypsin-like peptidase domain-containing protein [Streptomyces actinomycinicus]MBL1082272.1 trypsin-like peptidase domain-containing protein [Streptomyces actinomycinicus]
MAATDPRHPAAPPEGTQFEQGLARLFDDRGHLLGAGFLLTRDLVCTCAHVVADEDSRDNGRPAEPPHVDFPLAPGAPRERVTASVVAWHPAEDIAVLRLGHEVAGTAPLPLSGPGAPLYGREARLYGFPESTDTGVNAHGTLRGGQGAGLLQLDAGHGSVAIAPGFSGSPVWDVGAGHVVGMLATRGRGSLGGTAYLIPASRLAARAPHDAEDPGPFKGLLRFEERDAHLFLGRGKETETLSRAVRGQPLTLLTGQSGTGKSSLLHAGLLPRLRAARAVVVVRTPHEADGLAAALGEAVLALWKTAVPGGDTGSRLAAVREALTGDEVALAHLREELRAAFQDRLGVLVLDQFEEYAAAAPSAARQVVTWWRQLTAGAAPDRGLRAVLTARHATLDVLSAVLPARERARAVVSLDPLTEEALSEVISARLAPIPGAGLQDGLRDLLLRDARDAQFSRGESNALPLLEFTLTELWRRRSGGLLTLAAYQELGGLSGALAQHAQRTLDAAVAEGVADEQAARRLFQRLARPDGLGRFLPDSVPVGELDEEQQRLARRMAQQKLLAWMRPRPGHPLEESLGMAHEALLREWEWLRTCLREGAEFRAWQAELAGPAAAWEAEGRRPFASVPRKLLAAADRWEAERGRDITPAQLAYLAAGRRHVRRGAYLLRGFTAFVTVLTLIAAWLAWDANRKRDVIEAQLRTAASEQLAELARRRSATDFGLSVQMAMGAWATSATDTAHSQLFRQYLRMRDVERVHAGLWPGSVDHVTAASGTDVVAVTTEPAQGSRTVSVVTGATSDHPRVRRLGGVPTQDSWDTISDDGRWYAMASADGSVRLWEIGKDPEPRLLTGARPASGRELNPSLDFSDDSARLLCLHVPFTKRRARGFEQHAGLDVWDVASGHQVPGTERVIRSRAIAGRDLNGAAFADGRDDVTLQWIRVSSGDFLTSAGVFSLRDGREQRRLATDVGAEDDFMARGKVLSLHRSGPGPDARFLNVDGSAAARVTPRYFDGLDATGYYRTNFRPAEAAGDGPEYGVLSAVGVVRGDTWTAVVPGDGTSDQDARAVIWPGKSSGRPPAVAAVGDGLVRLRLSRDIEPLPSEDTAAEHTVALDPHKDRFATLDDGRLYLSRAGGPTRSVALPGIAANRTWTPHWVSSKEGERVAVADGNSLTLLLIAADDLGSRTEVDLAGHLRGAARKSRITSVAQLGNGELAVLLTSGDVLRVDPATGAVVASAQRVGLPESDVPDQLVPRPGHPDEALIVSGSGRLLSRLTTWDLVKNRRVAGWTSPTGVAGALEDGIPTAAFSPDGKVVALGHYDRKLRFYDAATGRRTGGVVTYPSAARVLAFIGDRVFASLTLDEGIRLHDVPTGDALGQGPATVGPYNFSAVVSGNRLRLTARGQLQSLDVDPDIWWHHLCRVADRPYTAAERKLLPVGAPTGRPCAQRS